jgi:CheY-like chemotaxis protein
MRPLNKILLVDDDEATNFLSQALIEKLHVAKEIVIAENGLIASRLIKEGECPDIIFLDNRMPEMDGFEFLDHFHDMKICIKTRIVMVTNSVLKKDQERALTYAQVIAYFPKPITKEIIESVVKGYYGDEV